jgi:LysR family hydrogen peroxide-inducible transcriptional activator
MRPTIRQLEYVVAVAEESSFSRAAKRCFVSQPALSNQVRQLEIQLGADLFERTSKGVWTTPFGDRVVALAHEVLTASDRIVDCADALKAPLSGPLLLGCVSTITPYLVPAAMSDLRSRFPELELQIRDGTADVLEAQLAAGEIDALIVPLPTGLAGCEEIEIARDAFLLVASSESELGRASEPVSPDVLRGHEILLLEDPHCLRRHALEVCQITGAMPHATLHATSLGVIVQLVRRGFGATLLPELAVGVELAGITEVRLKRFAEPAPGRRIGLAWRRGSPHAGGLRDFASVLMDHCSPGSPASG